MHYARGLSPAAGVPEDPESGPTKPATPPSLPPRFAAAVWLAISAKKVPGVVARPLDTAPAYWQRFVADRGGLSTTTVSGLYAEARTLLRAGF